MSAPEHLMDLYVGELKDLWSANDQMSRALTKFVTLAADPDLKELLTASQAGVSQHTETLKALIASAGETVSKDHCKGMEGLVGEATKHTTTEAPPKGPVLDAVMIAQYQRMTHYGIAGFGTAAAYASALGRKDDQNRLDAITKSAYGGDKYMTKLAEATVNIDAMQA